MKILVTGATGYIGGRLIQHLSDNSSHQLYATSRKIPKEMIEMFPDVHFCNIDLLKPGSTLTDLCKKVDCIIHLAAANEIQSKDDPVFACDINITASVRLLEIAKKARVKRFIYLSTAHVYGSPLVGTLNEKTPCYPMHPYAMTHKVVEDFVLASHQEQKIEGIVLRLSNSFGAPLLPSVDRWSLLLNELAKNAVKYRKIELKTTGEQYRDFITLTHTCAAIHFFIDCEATQLQDGLFNVGGNNTMCIKDMVLKLVRRCEVVLNYRPELIIPQRDSYKEKNVFAYSIEKLENIGFHIEKDIDTELDKLLLFCRNKYKEISHEIT
jgi:UDP-glucose 4-epimerase